MDEHAWGLPDTDKEKQSHTHLHVGKSYTFLAPEFFFLAH